SEAIAIFPPTRVMEALPAWPTRAVAGARLKSAGGEGGSPGGECLGRSCGDPGSSPDHAGGKSRIGCEPVAHFKIEQRPEVQHLGRTCCASIDRCRSQQAMI